ncbi:MAG: hypothetical protein KBF73_01935 [Flavobacteriales bacterium]|nr:hypothetical protein [Flavobacteriales bacterium]
MSPYDIPLSVVDEFLSTRAKTCFKRNNINTLDDLISLPNRDLYRLRNFGRKSQSEINDLQRSLIEDIDLYVQMAAEKELIDLSELDYDPKALVSACYKLMNISHPMRCHDPELDYHLYKNHVKTIQDVLLLQSTSNPNNLPTFHSEVAALKRKFLLPIQQRVLDARTEGERVEEPILPSPFHSEMLSSVLLIDHVPIQPPSEVSFRAYLNHVNAVSLYDVIRLERPLFDYQFLGETWELFTNYRNELITYLNEGSWTSLKFFDR